MTKDELKQKFPNASATFIRANATDARGTNVHADNARQTAKLERDPRNGTLAKVPVQRRHSGRFLIRLTSIRKRLLDEDNLCEKYHVDCCRYAGLLPGDAAGQTKIEVCQEKIEPGGAEEVRIEIFKL